MNYLRYKPRITLGYLGIKPTPTGYARPAMLSKTPPEPIQFQPPPSQFHYTREQLADMLARGASETYERSGESDAGLFPAFDLEQRSREIDANKQYVIDANGEVIAETKIPANTPKAGTINPNIALLTAVAAYFLLV